MHSKLKSQHSLILKRQVVVTNEIATSLTQISTTTTSRNLKSTNPIVPPAPIEESITSTSTTSITTTNSNTRLKTAATTRLTKTPIIITITSSRVDPAVQTNELTSVKTSTPVVVAQPIQTRTPSTSPRLISTSSATQSKTTPIPSSTILTSANSNSSSSQQKLSSGALIAMVVSAIVLILIIIGAFFGYKHYKKKKNSLKDDDNDDDYIIGNSNFNGKKENYRSDEGEDFGNSPRSYNNNNDNLTENEKFFNNSSGRGYGALADQSPGPNQFFQQVPRPLSPVFDSGFAGVGRRAVGGDSNQFMKVSSPMSTTPTFISSSIPISTSNSDNLGYTTQQQQRSYYSNSYPQLSPRILPPSSNSPTNTTATSRERENGLNHTNFSHNSSNSSLGYPPTSSIGSNTHLIRNKPLPSIHSSPSPPQAERFYTPTGEEDVASEIGSNAMMRATNPDEDSDSEEEGEDNFNSITREDKPLETITEQEDDENSPFGESENQGEIFLVKRTFEVTMEDELIIQPGDKILLLMKYDDGWALGENQSRNGEKIRGVFPIDCLELASSNSQSTQSDLPPPNEIGRAYSPTSIRSQSPYTFTAPQLPQIRQDSPLGNHFKPQHHSQKASLVNLEDEDVSDQPLTGNTFPSTPNTPGGGDSSILENYQFLNSQLNSPTITTTTGDGGDYYNHDNTRESELREEEGNKNRGGEKGKRSSSLNASRDQSLFAALKGVLGDSDDDDNDHEEEKQKSMK